MLPHFYLTAAFLYCRGCDSHDLGKRWPLRAWLLLSAVAVPDAGCLFCVGTGRSPACILLLLLSKKASSTLRVLPSWYTARVFDNLAARFVPLNTAIAFSLSKLVLQFYINSVAA